jgi:hypothetical protein
MRKYSHNVVMLALLGAAGWLALGGRRGPSDGASAEPFDASVAPDEGDHFEEYGARR